MYMRYDSRKFSQVSSRVKIMAKGDHVRVKRYGGIISHHGIDMGDGTVVHFRKDNSGSKALVDRTSMAGFSKGGMVDVVQHETPDKPNTVVKRASEYHKCPESYHLFERNCEHLATWCKTGKPGSQQVDDAIQTGKTLAQSASRPLFSIVLRKLFGG